MLLGSENRSTGASGVRKPKHRRALGSTWGRFGGSERRSGGVRERSGEAAGGRKKNFHFKKFKIMGLCKNLNMVLKRSEMN